MNATVVLEIGNPWLKMAVFRSVIGTYYLKSLSCVNAAAFSEDDTAKAILDFIRDLKVKKPQNTIVSFPRNTVTLRNLRIPSANPNEVDDMIKLHVGRQVPYAKEEIVSGYRIIGRDTMGYSKVMLAIVHRESIRKVFRILEKAGLYTDRVELGSDGILSWLCRATKATDLKVPEAFIILDIDSGFTDFVVSTTENILFSRVIALGSDQLNDESKWQKFIGEMKQTIVISQGEEVMQKPSKVFISGAVDKLKALASKIELEFNLPAQVVDPLTNLPLAKEVEKAPEDIFQKASLSALLGLGLDTLKKKINFVLPEAQIRKTLRERSRDMIFLASAIMYFILIVCGIYLEKMHNREAHLGLLTARYEKIAKEADGLNEKVERLKRIKAKLDTRSSALNYLYEISKLMPPEIVILNIAFQKDDKLSLKGRTLEMSDVFKFITVLEGSPLFKEVSTRYTTRKKVKEKDMIEFELACPVEGTVKKKPGKE
ncbi:MAG: pilus assembly protein PilM [Candidatus Omnitrophica bacterium]|nr:pilus assembly protein PilM [Candidatus Omnitrophota bacterium]